jgi:endonuclease/exonuclease/phosphatase family metal-dependent hydrolase
MMFFIVPVDFISLRFMLSSMHDTFRIASYNIHQGFGLDLRMQTSRIGEVLQELNADLIGLQEVYQPQAEELAAQLGYSFEMVGTEQRRRGLYGNVILSRAPLSQVRRFSLAQSNKEPRAGIWGSFSFGGQAVHFVNVHLGLSEKERAEQARQIQRVLSQEVGPKILVGDTNEWRDKDAARILSSAFTHTLAPKTFPAFLPLVRLDRIFFDAPLRNVSTTVWKSSKAKIASDHAPVIADFSLH